MPIKKKTKKDKFKKVTITLSPTAFRVLGKRKNKSGFINKLILGSLIILATACEYVTPDQYKKADASCVNNEGLKEIRVSDGIIRATCNNKAIFYL